MDPATVRLIERAVDAIADSERLIRETRDLQAHLAVHRATARLYPPSDTHCDRVIRIEPDRR